MALRYHRHVSDKQRVKDKETLHDEEAECIITVTESNKIKLMENTQYSGSVVAAPIQANGKNQVAQNGQLINWKNDVQVFQFETKQPEKVSISLYECQGEVSFKIYQVDSKQFVQFQNFYEKYGKIETFGLAVGEYEILVQPKQQRPTSWQNNTYLISIDFINQQEESEWKQYASSIQKPTYLRGNNGIIQHELIQNQLNGQIDIKFTWWPIKKVDNEFVNDAYNYQDVKGVKYVLIQSDNPLAKMESLCAIEDQQDMYTQIAVIDTDNYEYTYHNYKGFHENVMFNVFAIQDDQQVVLPYVPVIIGGQENIDQHQFSMFIVAAILALALITVVAFWLYMKNKVLKKKLEEEVKEVVSASGEMSSSYGNLKNQSKDEDND